MNTLHAVLDSVAPGSRYVACLSNRRIGVRHGCAWAAGVRTASQAFLQNARLAPRDSPRGPHFCVSSHSHAPSVMRLARAWSDHGLLSAVGGLLSYKALADRMTAEDPKQRILLRRDDCSHLTVAEFLQLFAIAPFICEYLPESTGKRAKREKVRSRSPPMATPSIARALSWRGSDRGARARARAPILALLSHHKPSHHYTDEDLGAPQVIIRSGPKSLFVYP